jgi:heme-degrading monooxygenase HmoA
MPDTPPLCEQPAYAVIFTSRRTGGDNGYAETANRLAGLAASMPGYLGAQSVRDADGSGITVSYWDSLQAIAAWKDHPEHKAARARMDEWYESWSLRVCRVERGRMHPA